MTPLEVFDAAARAAALMFAGDVRIGSLFSGYGGLDAGVRSALGGEVAWHVENDSAASRVLAHHWPDVPNLGDVTAVDWRAVDPVDVLTAGYPCQPFSAAGKRLGEDDDRYLWPEVARAVRDLGPRLVVLENVAGHLVRGFPAVLGSLAEIGYDARWVCVRASDVGAPHRRERLFAVAWPTTRYAANEQQQRPIAGRDRRGRPEAPPGDAGGAAAYADVAAGDERRLAAPGQAEGGRARPDTGGRGRAPTADSSGDGRHEGRPEPEGLVGGHDAAERGDELCPTCGCEVWKHDAGGHCAGPCGGTCTDPEWGRPAAADAEHGGRGRRAPVTVGEPVGRAAAARGGESGGRGAAPADADGDGLAQLGRVEAVEHHPDRRDRARQEVAWGPYAPAIARWEHTLRRAAPAPTELSDAYRAMLRRRLERRDPRPAGRRGSLRPRHVLSPRFVEWLMGLPAGHVTGVPGLSRNDMLRLLGNGVVPQQAAAAIEWLLDVEAVSAA